MIAVDSSSLIAFLAGDDGDDRELLRNALRQRRVALPPVVLTEMLSARKGGEDVAVALGSLPLLTTTEGYWFRAGHLRAAMRGFRAKAALADTLICQSCLDYDVPLLTRDRDFRAFAKYAGLKLA